MSGLELVQDPDCDCFGCDARRRTRKLCEEAVEGYRPRIERLMASEHEPDAAALAAVRRQMEAHLWAITRAMACLLAPCSRLAIRVTP